MLDTESKDESAKTETTLTARSRRTRRKLVAAASKLMAEVGIEAVSVSAAAQNAGITRPGAYYHFKSREELLDAVRKELDQQLVKGFDDMLNRENVYSFEAELAVEDEDLIRFRIMRMIKSGSNKDALITTRHKSLARLKRQSGLQPGVDPYMAAIVSTATIAAALLAVSGANKKESRHTMAKLFGRTYYELIFFGALKQETLNQWPELPKFAEKPDAVTSGEDCGAVSEKPSNVRSSRTRSLLLQAAMELLVEVGEEATLVSEVARRAGVSRPGAYYHFKTKEELLAAVREKLDSEFLYTIDCIFASSDPFSDVSGLADEEQNVLYLRVKQMIQEKMLNDPLVVYQKKLFRWHQKHGHLRQGVDPDMAAIIVSAAMMVGVVLAVSDSDVAQERQNLIKRFGKTYDRFLFHGMVNYESRSDWPAPPKLN